MTNEPSSEAFFDAKYRHAPDPWAFATSDYEQARYATLLSAIAHQTFQRAFEPGCSIGVLTERLAPICGRLEAMDISATAVSRARERCGHLRNVTISHGALPADMPAGPFDLIVFSEIGYYFNPGVLTNLCEELVDTLVPGGVFLGVHWLGTSPDHLLSGDQVHDSIGKIPGLALQASQRFQGFRVDRWERL